MLCRLPLIPLLLTVAFVSGCSSDSGPVDRGPLGTVSGTVTFGGQPATEGSVDFYENAKGFIAHATIGSDGKFQLSPGTPVGNYKVTVTPPQTEVQEIDPVAVETAEPPPEKKYPNLPEKYRQTSTSGLTLEIKEGENTLEIKMTK